MPTRRRKRRAMSRLPSVQETPLLKEFQQRNQEMMNSEAF